MFIVFFIYPLSDKFGKFLIDSEALLMFKIEPNTSNKSISFASSQSNRLHEFFYKW